MTDGRNDPTFFVGKVFDFPFGGNELTVKDLPMAADRGDESLCLVDFMDFDEFLGCVGLDRYGIRRFEGLAAEGFEEVLFVPRIVFVRTVVDAVQPGAILIAPSTDSFCGFLGDLDS